MTRSECLFTLLRQYQRPPAECVRMTSYARRNRPWGIVYPTLGIALAYRGFNNYEILRCVNARGKGT